MGNHFECSSRFSCRRKLKKERQTKTLSEENVRSSSNGKFVQNFLPERYLSLLSEQMIETLFRLLNSNQLLKSSNAYFSRNNFRSSLQWQSVHQMCHQCQRKMLNIQQFNRLQSIFRYIDNDHDRYLTKDDIRVTLDYLPDLTEVDIKEMISLFDTNKDNRISFDEYIGKKFIRLSIH